MTSHPIDELVACALGDLDTDTARAVLTHADGCPACAAVLAEAMTGVAALSEADGERTSATPLRRPMRRNGTAWFAAASAAAAVLLLGWNLDLRSEGTPPPIDALVHSHFTHHALAGAGGSGKLVQALDGSWVYVIADGLQPFRSYTLEVDGEDVGAVRADIAGRASGYWQRTRGSITSATLSGAGTDLRWRER